MTRYSASLIINYLQTKITMQNNLISVRMAIIKALQIINAGEGMEKRDPHPIGENVNCAATMENSIEVC